MTIHSNRSGEPLPAVKFLLTALAVSFLAMGCATPRHGALLFGMYAVPKEDLKSAKAMGIDFVVGPKGKEYLEAVQAAGLRVIGSGTNFPRHPALLGNYLSDEPDLNGISPAKIEKEYRAAKRRSSRRVYLNTSAGSSVESYARYCDVVMFDWYPIGWQPLETFYAQLRLARLAAREKPFFAVVQAFSWANYPKLMPPSAEYRKPTAAEVKAMAIWAAMSGASGIAFYPFDDGLTDLRDSPELVEAIQQSIQEIRAHQQFLLAKKVWGTYPFSFPEGVDKYNAVFDPAIAVKYAQAPGKSDRLLLTAANTTSRVIKVRTQPGLLDDTAQEMTFAPLEVKLLTVRRLRQ